MQIVRSCRGLLLLLTVALACSIAGCGAEQRKTDSTAKQPEEKSAVAELPADGAKAAQPSETIEPAPPPPASAAPAAPPRDGAAPALPQVPSSSTPLTESLDLAPPPKTGGAASVDGARAAPSFDASATEQEGAAKRAEVMSRLKEAMRAEIIRRQEAASREEAAKQGIAAERNQAVAPANEQPSAAAPVPIEEPPTAAAAAPADSQTPPSEQDDYSVVKVYYATDRAREDAASEVPPWVGWLSWTLGCAGVTLILVAVAYRYYPVRLMRILLIVAGAVAIVFSITTAYAVWHGWVEAMLTQETKVCYGAERGELQLGTCSVSIPKQHQLGELESPSILRFEIRKDPHKHVVLLSVTPQPADAFYADMRACIDRTQQKGAFVFIHGYNVEFADAARRTAQIAYDLGYQGAPICYSWPSQGKLSGYTVDETNVEWTVSHLKQFLIDVASRSGAQQIHLIAHSMGNRALTSALRYLSYEAAAKRPKFREVILTAPDIDAEVFKRDIAPAIVGTADRVTLYASSNDEALRLSKEVHGYARAGDTDGDPVLVPGLDTIDVSAVDTSLLGHFYYSNNQSVLDDLIELLHDAKPPQLRKWLRMQHFGPFTYWVFLPKQAGDATR